LGSVAKKVTTPTTERSSKKANILYHASCNEVKILKENDRLNKIRMEKIMTLYNST